MFKYMRFVLMLIIITFTILEFFSPFSKNTALATRGDIGALSGIYSASTTNGANVVSNAKDGNLTTYWQASTSAKPQWLQVDLGGLYSLNKIEQTFNVVDTWSFKVVASIDGTNWATIIDKTKSANGKTFNEGVSGTFRYVKLTVTNSANASNKASSVEFRIFGSDEGVNIAAGKVTTASSYLTNQPPSGLDFSPKYATDDSTSSYWCAGDGSYTNKYLTVDLGSPCIITGVEQNFKDFDAHWKFKINVSNDGTNFNTEVVNNIGTGVAGQSFRYNFSGVYRYVRLTITGSDSGAWADSTEFKVYGFDHLALGKPIAGYSSQSSDPNYAASNMVDGDFNTAWCASGPGMPQWITVDLAGLCDLKRVEQNFWDTDGPITFQIYGAQNAGGPWTQLMSKSGVSGQTFYQDVSGQYRYIKLNVDSYNHWANSRELRVYGTPLERNLSLGVLGKCSTLATGYGPDKVMDGDASTYWCADSQTMSQTLTLDLGNDSIVKRLEQSFVDSDIWKFIIEGCANDSTTWVMLMDKSGNTQSAKDFVQDVSGKYRYVKLTVIAGSHWANSKELKIIGIGSPVRSKFWEDTTGTVRVHLKKYGIPLSTITSQLDTYKSQGYNAVELIAPYAGPGDIWSGLGATDNYNIDPSVGTMADFTNLINTAHSKGMKVTMFGNVGYCRDTAPFFTEACDDVRDGPPYGDKVYWFHFILNPKTQDPDRPGENYWYWSDRANAWYLAAWGNFDPVNIGGKIPSYTFLNQQWRDECKKYVDFWMNKGLDGLALDAVPVYDGITKEINNKYITDIIQRYGAWANAEGIGNLDPQFVWDKHWNYNIMQDYSMGWWGGESSVLQAIDAMNPNRAYTCRFCGGVHTGIEGILKAHRDNMNHLGGSTLNSPCWELEPVSSTKRLLEIATQSLTGAQFYILNNSDTIRPIEDILPTWPAADRETLYSIMRAQNSYKALEPSGLRIQLPTNDNNKYYAFKRQSKDGSSKALVIMNYQNTAQNITVNLTNTDIGNQIPVDLLTGGAGTAITGTSYAVNVPAYGFKVLGVN